MFNAPPDTVIVTDSLQTTENLVGGFDQDTRDDRRLAIRWNSTVEGIIDFHVYVRFPNGEREFIGRTGDPNRFYLEWADPLFGQEYYFDVYGILQQGEPVLISTTQPVLYLTATTATPTPTETATPTMTPTPFLFPIESNRIVVTDDLQSTEDLIGLVDQDADSNRALAIRWNANPQGVTDFHLYVRVDGRDPVYLARTGSPERFYYEWRARSPLVVRDFAQGPQFGHTYRFLVFAVRPGQSAIRLTAANAVSFQSSGEPTSTPTPTPTATATPRVPDVENNAVAVTDDRSSTINLVGGFDQDPPENRALAIHWITAATGITDFHVYASVNGATQAYLGRTGSGEILFYEWKERSPRVDPAFSRGPQFDTRYRFHVFGLRPGLRPVRLLSGGELLFLMEGVEPPATPTPIPTATGTPTQTQTPTNTDTPTPTATPTEVVTPLPTPTPRLVVVTDSLQTQDDLSNGEDADSPSDRELVIRWNLGLQNIRDYHVYVEVNGGPPQFLGRTGNGLDNFYSWKPNAPNLDLAFSDGPQYNNRYQFRIFALSNDQSNTVFTPFMNAGPVRFVEASP